MTISRNSNCFLSTLQEQGFLLLQGVSPFVDRNKITFTGAGPVEIVAAVGIFIKKENILHPVSVYVFRGQKVVGD